MPGDWSTVTAVADDVAIGGGIAFLVVRQFLWRSAELRHLLRVPVVIVALGTGYLVAELWTAHRWVPGDLLVLAELALATLTGVAMGRVTRFRHLRRRLQYKLSGAGVALWAVLAAVRTGFSYLARTLGSDLAGATGPLLISFGANRLLSVLVVRARTDKLLGDGGGPPCPANGSA